MKKITLAIGTAALALTGIAAGAAQAQQDAPPPGKQRMWDGPMANKTVTRAEAQEKAGTMFDKLDVNKDGKLDKADREAKMGQKFDSMDTNKDGALSRAEFMAAHEGRPGDGMRGHGKRGHHGGKGMKMLAAMDTNKDGAVSRAEFQAGAMKRFDAADANNDGTVTPEERRAAMQSKRQQMQGWMGRDMPPPPADDE